MIPLLSAAMSNGITMNDIAENPNILFNPEKIGINKSLTTCPNDGYVCVYLIIFMVGS
jgi:hypothetical protein